MREDIIYLTETTVQQDVTALHVPTALTNISVGYENAEFVAERVSPTVPVDKPSDKYYVFGKEKFRRYDDNYTPGTTPGEIGWGLSSTAYTCSGHAVRGWYPAQAPSAADVVIDLDVETTENVADARLLAKEMNLRDMLVTGLAPTDLSGTGGQYQFDNPDFDPVPWFQQQGLTVAKQVGKMPNTLLLGVQAWTALRNNPNLLKHIAVGPTTLDVAPRGPVSVQDVQTKLEIPEIIVGAAMYDTATLGQAASLDFIWGKYALLFYKSPTVGRRKVSLTYTFRWNVGIQGQIVNKWYDQNKYRQVIDGQEFYAQAIVAAGAGLMWSKASSV